MEELRQDYVSKRFIWLKNDTMLKRFLISFALALITISAAAQTPYDAFAPEQSVKRMNMLELKDYLLENSDTTATIRSVVIDWSRSSYTLIGKDGINTSHGLISELDKKFLTVDPNSEDYSSSSPYAYCAGDPVNYVDPTGCDTVRIEYKDNHWNISDPIIAKGDDVFIVTIDGVSETHIFSEGEYGNRVNMLLLSENSSETFGVYQLSGSDQVGFSLQPSGYMNAKPKRVSTGLYKTYIGYGQNWYGYIGLSGNDATPGIRVHYGTNVKWSTGCILLSNDYYMSKGSIKFNIDDSRSAVWNYVQYLGADDIKPTNNPTGKPRDKYHYPSTHRVNSSYFLIKSIFKK